MEQQNHILPKVNIFVAEGWMNKSLFQGYVLRSVCQKSECDRHKTHLVAAPLVADCSLVLACPAFVTVC